MGHLSVTAHDYLLTHGEKKGVREREREREPGMCKESACERERQQDREQGCSGSGGKGWVGYGKGLKEVGVGWGLVGRSRNLVPFFYSFIKIGSGPVSIPTWRIYDRSVLHIVTWWMENILVYLGHNQNGNFPNFLKLQQNHSYSYYYVLTSS